MPNQNELEETIDRIIKMYPSGERTCENIALAGTKGRTGCILFDQSDNDVYSAVLADAVNMQMGEALVASSGTCMATGARVTEGARCGVADQRFRMGVRNLLEGKTQI